MKKIKLRMLSRASMLNNSKTFHNTSLPTLPLGEQTKAMAALNKAEKVRCILFMQCSLKQLWSTDPQGNTYACNSRAYTHSYNKIVLVRV